MRALVPPLFATLILALAATIAAQRQPPAEPVHQSYIVKPTVIPKTMTGVLDALRETRRHAQALVDGKPIENVYVVFTRARDLELALQPYVARLPPARRARADASIRTGIRAAWLLHTAADEGTGIQAVQALRAFRDAMDGVIDAFTENRAQ